MSDTAILTEYDDGVLLVTLNRPHKRNAFDDAQWDGLAEALDQARGDDSVAVVVMTGAGEDFSSGQDLSAFGTATGPRADGNPTGFQGCVDAVFEFDKPLLAAVKGVAVGGGATLAIASDIVYVGESVRLRLPFVSLGLVPEGASSYLLQQVVGSRQAAELFYSAEWIDAARAVEVGIATARFPDEALLEATLARAREIAQWPVGALRATKRTLLAAHAAGIRAALEAEDAGMSVQAGSPENMEAVRAFLEKRPPDFKALRSR